MREPRSLVGHLRSGRAVDEPTAKSDGRRNVEVGALCALAAVGAALAPGAATQHAFVDLLWRTGLAVAVTLAATRAHPWTWVFAAALAVVVATQDLSLIHI